MSGPQGNPSEDLVARLESWGADDADSEELYALLAEASREIKRLRNIETLSKELIETGLSLRFTSGPALSVIEKYDRSDPHYRLCEALDLHRPRART